MIRKSLLALILATCGVLLPPALPESPFAARVEAAEHYYHVVASGPRHTGITPTVHRDARSRAQAELWRQELLKHYRTVKIEVRSRR